MAPGQLTNTSSLPANDAGVRDASPYERNADLSGVKLRGQVVGEEAQDRELVYFRLGPRAAVVSVRASALGLHFPGLAACVSVGDRQSAGGGTTQPSGGRAASDRGRKQNDLGLEENDRDLEENVLDPKEKDLFLWAIVGSSRQKARFTKEADRFIEESALFLRAAVSDQEEKVFGRHAQDLFLEYHDLFVEEKVLGTKESVLFLREKAVVLEERVRGSKEKVRDPEENDVGSKEKVRFTTAADSRRRLQSRMAACPAARS